MTHNYHTDLVIKIDIFLLLSSILLTIIIILYSAAREYRDRRRRRALLDIKRHTYELVLSESNVCLPVATDASLQQFLDVQTNRIRDGAFFNSTEQEAFAHCYVTPEKITQLEVMARRHHNKWRRIEAILALGYAQAQSALNVLKQTISSRDADISYFTIIALGRIKTVGSAKILLGSLKKNFQPQHAIASVLTGFPADIADDILKLAENRSPSIRAWALDLLAEFRPEQYRKEIEAFASDASADVRASACYCLGKMGGSKSKEILLRCLGDDSWIVRGDAVIALSDALGRGSITHIIGLINDASISVIESVKEAIRRHAESALPYVEKIFKGEDEFAKKIAREALDSAGYDPATLKPKVFDAQ